MINKNDFFRYSIDNGNCEILFSNANNDIDFNLESKIGRINLEKLIKEYSLNDLGWMKQIHSDNIIVYDGKVQMADGIITDKINIGIGVFTADCVPIMFYCKKKKVCAAVHSGWQGTRKEIVSKMIDKLKNRYDISLEDLTIVIGPHNRKCCYEFGENMAKTYFNKYINENKNTYDGKNLNLEECIIMQVLEKGIRRKNIITNNSCTYCDQENKFYSYRKLLKNKCGRMFSFVVIRNR